MVEGLLFAAGFLSASVIAGALLIVAHRERALLLKTFQEQATRDSADRHAMIEAFIARDATDLRYLRTGRTPERPDDVMSADEAQEAAFGMIGSTHAGDLPIEVRRALGVTEEQDGRADDA